MATHDLDALVNAYRILNAISTDPKGRDKVFYEIGRAEMTLKLAIGSRVELEDARKPKAVEKVPA